MLGWSYLERVEHNPSALLFSLKNLPGALASLSEADFYPFDSLERKSMGADAAVSFLECVLLSGVCNKDGSYGFKQS